MGAASSRLQEGPMLAPETELREAAGPARGRQGGASEDGAGPAPAVEGPAAPPPPPPSPPGTAWQAGERKALAMLDGLSVAHGCTVVVSFPGMYQDDWNNLVATARMMQELGSSRSWFSTACIFLPEGDPNLGEHSPDTVTNNGCCFCKKLYGEQKTWGCRWFEYWRQQLHLALQRGQKPVVVYKAGQAGEGDAYTWEEFPIPFATDRRGLGGSQAGEVAYLRYYLGLLGLTDSFEKWDVKEFASEMYKSSYFGMRNLLAHETGYIRLVTAMANCPEVKKGLAQLVLTSSDLKEADGLALARALPACSALKMISLSNNPLGDAAGEAIARALPALPALEVVDLRGAILGQAAGLELARALPACAALQRIDLSGNGLEGEEGARDALRRAAAARGVQLNF